jgi:hypothetical protein
MSNIPPPLPPSSPPGIPAGLVPPPPPLPQSNETVKAVIENLDQKTGMFSKVTYRLIITNQRLVFALQQKNVIDYLQQNPSLTLAENPANFMIPMEQLVKIETYSAGMDDSTPDSMVVITPSQKLKFNIKNYYKVQKQLKDVLGNRAS